MKMSEIRKKNQFNQNTFYGWLRDEELIRKTPTGYVIGDKAINGMETLLTPRINEDGEVINRTQVIVDDSIVSQIIEK